MDRKGVKIKLGSKERAYTRMKISDIPHPPALFVLGRELYERRESVEEFLSPNDPSLVIMKPLLPHLKKRGKFFIRNFKDLVEFLHEVDCEEYKICSIRMVEGIEEGYVGTVISDGHPMVVEI